jgi:predicted ferric reductase
MTTTIAGSRTSPSTPPVAPPGERRGTHPRIVLGGIAVGGAATIGLWLANSPPEHSFGDWLTGAGRITGLAAGYTVVILLALMARIPALERGIGADRLTRWHSMGGRYTVCLVVAHATLITWGYSVSAHTGVVHQTSELLLSYPDVLMATVAGGLFVMVGIVSARAARKRMRYETWYLLHLYTYLAIALAFSHQFANGDEFISNKPARVVWAGLYVVVGALLVWYRFVTPVRQLRRHSMRVLAVHQEVPGVVSLLIKGKHLGELGVAPGQFLRFRFLTKDLWWASNPYSLSAPVQPDLLRITVRELGDHSGALKSLRPGTRVYAEGPYGAFTAARRSRHKVLLIAGGVGITPVRALFETLPQPSHVTLLYRASTPEDVVFYAELERIAKARHSTVRYLIGRRADLGYDPLGASSLRTLVRHIEQHDVYICGPEGMTNAVRASLRECGVPARHIHHESFEF